MPAANIDRVRNTFSSWARYYDATHGSSLLYRREAVLALGVKPGDRVLDLACGTGLGFSYLRQMAGSEVRIVGVDVTPAMLEIARQRIARHEWDNVEVREADAAHLPFPDSSFERAICMYGMSIIPDYARAIAEVRRVLVPGGRFVVLDVKLSDNPLARWLAPLFLRMGHICAVDMSHRTIDELRRAFVEVHVREHRAGFVYVAVATKGRVIETLDHRGVEGREKPGVQEVEDVSCDKPPPLDVMGVQIQDPPDQTNVPSML